MAISSVLVPKIKGASYNSTAGGVMSVSGTVYYMNFENLEIDNGFVTQGTNMTTNPSLAWRFTADESSFYDFSACARISNSVNQNTGVSIGLVKNVLTTPLTVREGSYTSVTTGSTAGEQGSIISGQIYLLKGETLSFSVVNFTGSSKALVNRASVCYCAIVKSAQR